MQRIAPSFDTEPIRQALDLLPPRLHELLAGTHFLCGYDPVFVGCHTFRSAARGGDTVDYGRVAHCLWALYSPPHTARATVVIPRDLRHVYPWLDPAAVVIHELGHVLDEQSGFACWPNPVNSAAEQDQYEAFAEAFTAWVCPDRMPAYSSELLAQDPATVAFFAELAR